MNGLLESNEIDTIHVPVHSTVELQLMKKNYVWADHMAKVCFIFYKPQLRWEECFID